MGKRKPPLTEKDLKNILWKDYIKSNEWNTFRKTLDGDDVVCPICSKPRWEFYKKTGKRKKKPTMQFQAHHLNYDNLGHETKDDVLYICRVCHNLGHELFVASRTRGGVYTTLYEIFCKLTPWEYTPFKDRTK